MRPIPAYSASRSHAIIFTIAILLLSIMVTTHFHRSERWDKAWKLEATQELYAGKELYTGIFEMNPPSQFWLYSIPVYLSNHFPPLKDYHFLVLMGMLTISYVVYICSRLIALHPMFADDTRKQAEFCLLLVTVLITCQFPIYFFDREHIFFVLILPYLFRFMPSLAKAPVPPTLSIITGLLAGVGFCIKPHCFIVFAGIQLFYFWRERSLAILKSPENILIYVLQIIYIACIWIYTPEYLTIVLPVALATYGAIGKSLRYEVSYVAYTSLPLGIAFVNFRWRHASPFRKDIVYLAFLLLFFLGYVMANNGWNYTWNLLFTLAVIITGFMFWEYSYLRQEHEAEGQPVRLFIYGQYACIAAFAYGAGYVLFHVYWEDRWHLFFTLTPIIIGLMLWEYSSLRQEPEAEDHPVRLFTFEQYARMTIFAYGATYALFHVYPGLKVNDCGDTFECPEDKAFIKKLETANGGKLPSSFGTISTDYFIFWSGFVRATGVHWETRFYQYWMLPKFFTADATFTARHQWIIDYVGHSLAEDLKNQKPQCMFVQDIRTNLLTFLEESPDFIQEWQHYRFVTRIDNPEEPTTKKIHHGFLVYRRTD